ncbi:PEP-CTERM sorting domain-containing protein [Pseudoduganella aquatica]|uniref:PEP-CTERM sorting domain-containing protein n=1 Tax=Pseudoduganella aquatica TaxID=2660641 RepID=UPI001E611C12|nr:PEP-CTERM sorting domain-containing protein [Pseudoduganella aquatica]
MPHCIAHATLTPSYPPPGGVTFSGAGTQGATGGRTNTYSGFNTSAFGQLYWGASTASLPGAALDGSVDPLTFSSINGTTATWTGVTNWYDQQNGVTGTVQMRLLIDIGGLGATPWLLASTIADMNAATGAVVNVSSAASFTANLQFQANTGSGFQAINNISVLQGNTRTSFGGAFYATPAQTSNVPEPGSLALASLGLGALALIRRRKAAAN